MDRRVSLDCQLFGGTKAKPSTLLRLCAVRNNGAPPVRFLALQFLDAPARVRFVNPHPCRRLGNEQAM